VTLDHRNNLSSPMQSLVAESFEANRLIILYGCSLSAYVGYIRMLYRSAAVLATGSNMRVAAARGIQI
jgi:hypothetical protein